MHAVVVRGLTYMDVRAPYAMSKVMAALFGKPPVPVQDQAKEWKKQLKSEMRNVDKQVRAIQRAQAKVIMEAKAAAKKNDVVAVRTLSKELLHSRKACNRLMTAKTQMNSVIMQVDMQVSQMKLMGALQKSTQVMTSMNQLLKVHEVNNVMRAMSMEMTKAGLIEEMVGDTLDNALDDDVSEGELDDEVNKVVEDVMSGKLSAAKIGTSRLPERAAAAPAEAEEEEPVEEDEADAELAAKFAAMKAGAA